MINDIVGTIIWLMCHIKLFFISWNILFKLQFILFTVIEFVALTFIIFLTND